MKNYTKILWLVFLIMLATRPTWAQQSWQWVSNASGASGTNVQVETDDAGNIIVAGNFSGTLALGTFTLTSAGNSDVFVARLNAAGTCTAAVRGGGVGPDYLYGLTLDGVGNPIVSGYFAGTAIFGATTLVSAGAEDLFIARLDAANNWTQAVRAGGAGSDYAQDVKVDANGNVLVAGTFSANASFDTISLASAGGADLYVAWLSAAGRWLQAVQAGGPGFDSASSIAVDGAGNAVITGYFNQVAKFGGVALTSAGKSDLFVARLSPTGDWTQVIQGGGVDSEYGNSVALDGVGNAVVTAYFYGTTQLGPLARTSAGLADILVARLSAAGTWVQAVRAGGTAMDLPGRLTVDAGGNTFISATFMGTTSFGPISLTSAGGYDAALAVLSPTGSWTRAVRGGGEGDDMGWDIVVGANGAATLGGGYASPAVFSPFTVAGSGGGAFVASLAAIGLSARAATPADAFTLAPNPATTQVRLAWSAAAPRVVQVLDALGREVRHQMVPTASATLDIAGLPPGVYVVRCGPTTARLQVE